MPDNSRATKAGQMTRYRQHPPGTFRRPVRGYSLCPINRICREDTMARRDGSIRTALLAGSILAGPALAADVTPQRLVNADKEPQNWLMNHRTYDGQRFSPLDKINKGNVQNLKIAYAVPLGTGGVKQFIEATPLAEDGFLYITDSGGELYKI